MYFAARKKLILSTNNDKEVINQINVKLTACCDKYMEIIYVLLYHIYFANEIAYF